MEYIITVFPSLAKAALMEIKQIDANAEIRRETKELFLVSSSKKGFQRTLKKTIFVRHVHPVCAKTGITGKKDDIQELTEIARSIITAKKGLFMVQCRKEGNTEYACKDIEVNVGRALEKIGWKAKFNDNEIVNLPSLNIVSITISNNMAYLGVSKAKDNIEPHLNPARVYSRTPYRISRAECKLKEAIQTFGIKIRKGEKALDIGAAPGGWSHVLSSMGAEVTAIDPADLDRCLKVRHFKCRAEDFESNEKFEIIVNDMNIHPYDSARIMLKMRKFLKRNADAIFTIKFVKRDYFRIIDETKKILETAYKIKAVKNLFHNREEATLYCKAR